MVPSALNYSPAHALMIIGVVPVFLYLVFPLAWLRPVIVPLGLTGLFMYLAVGWLVWLFAVIVGGAGLVVAYRDARRYPHQAKWQTAVLCLVTGIAMLSPLYGRALIRIIN